MIPLLVGLTLPGMRVLNYGNPVNRAAPLNRGLVSWWINLPTGGKGNTWFDGAGKNHGALTNGPTWGGALGRPGGWGSLSFDGTDDRVDVPTSMSVANGVTYTAWMKPTSLPASYLGIRGNRKTFLAVNGTALQWFPNSDTTIIADDVFTLVAGDWTWVGVTQVGTSYAMYVNGQPAKSGTTVALNDASEASTIGSFSATLFFPGALDDLRDFPFALSASGMNGLYHASRQGYPHELNWLRRPAYVEQGGGAAAFQYMSLLGVGI